MNVMNVPEDIGIKKIKTFYLDLSEVLKNSDGDIILDLANVKDVDLSFPQVLIAANKYMKQKGRIIKLQSVCANVKERLKLAGIK